MNIKQLLLLDIFMDKLRIGSKLLIREDEIKLSHTIYVPKGSVLFIVLFSTGVFYFIFTLSSF